MSSDNTQEKNYEIFFTFTQVNKGTQAQLFEKINKEIEVFLSKENIATDSTDGIFDFLNKTSDSVQEEFEELLSSDSNKKRLARALSKIFTLLLNTKVDTAKEIKRIIQIAIETTFKKWPEPRQQYSTYL